MTQGRTRLELRRDNSKKSIYMSKTSFKHKIGKIFDKTCCFITAVVAYLGSDLVAALACLDVHDFSHGCVVVYRLSLSVCPDARKENRRVSVGAGLAGPGKR